MVDVIFWWYERMSSFLVVVVFVVICVRVGEKLKFYWFGFYMLGLVVWNFVRVVWFNWNGKGRSYD